jgi:hypothetical protein
MTTINKNKEVSSVKQLMAGANEHFPTAAGTPPMSIGGAKYTLADLTQRLQTFVDISEGVDTAKAAYQEKLNEATTQMPALRSLISAFKAYVRANFGNSPGDLVDFGLVPRKVPQPRTVEARAIAVEKGLATRKARKTMGKNQKKLVTGTVDATAANPAPAGTTPVAPGPVASAPSPGTSGGTTPHTT